jgi:transposase
MIEPELVRQVRGLTARGWGAKRIAAELGIARNTVRRYVRGGDDDAEVQVRRAARKLDDDARAEARQLFTTVAEGNAVVVTDELAKRGVGASVRTVQRVVRDQRQQKLAADVASVRFETAPGQQMQIDFGQKLVCIAGAFVRIHLLVAVLSYSRRIYVRAFHAERGDDWREGIAGAFRHFGGVVREVLGDNARALVAARDRASCTITFHPAYLAFCRDCGVVPKACGPYRARTKGKTESGVKYVKRNCLAGRRFDSFDQLQSHIVAWMAAADERVHGTTRERPADRFERDERHALRPLPALPLPPRVQRLRRVVSNDAFVDVDTVRYSVPHLLVRERVDVHVAEQSVRVFRGSTLVAAHSRSFEPFAVVSDSSHHAGLWRPQQLPTPGLAGDSALRELGRSLDDYAAIIAEVHQ